MTPDSNTTGLRERTGTRTARESPDCPRCDDAVLGLTIAGVGGPRVWPCGHRITERDADRLTGAGPAVATGEDAEG